MPHAEPEILHRYLASALEPDEREALEAHLTACSGCALTLAELATEDAILGDALGLDAADRAWLESVDLVVPVMAEVAPRFRLTPPVILTSLLILMAGYLAGSFWTAGAGLFTHWKGVGGIVNLAHDLLPSLIDLLAWLSRGGLLMTLWPVIALGALYGFWRLTQIKETNPYA